MTAVAALTHVSVVLEFAQLQIDTFKNLALILLKVSLAY